MGSNRPAFVRVAQANGCWVPKIPDGRLKSVLGPIPALNRSKCPKGGSGTEGWQNVTQRSENNRSLPFAAPCCRCLLLLWVPVCTYVPIGTCFAPSTGCKHNGLQVLSTCTSICCCVLFAMVFFCVLLCAAVCQCLLLFAAVRCCMLLLCAGVYWCSLLLLLIAAVRRCLLCALLFAAVCLCMLRCAAIFFQQQLCLQLAPGFTPLILMQCDETNAQNPDQWLLLRPQPDNTPSSTTSGLP